VKAVVEFAEKQYASCRFSYMGFVFSFVQIAAVENGADDARQQ